MATGNYQLCVSHCAPYLMHNCVVSHAFIPGFTLALGFMPGGIISPPDAISATTIMRQVNAPRTLVSFYSIMN